MSLRLSDLVGEGERQRGEAGCLEELGRECRQQRRIAVPAGAVDPDRVPEPCERELEAVATSSM